LFGWNNSENHRNIILKRTFTLYTNVVGVHYKQRNFHCGENC